MKRFLMAVFLAAFCLPVLAADEVDGSNLTADVNACDYEPAKGKLYKTKTGKTIDCRPYYVMSLYGYQGYEGNVSMGMDPEAMCRGTIYYCEYIGNGKFKRSPINLSYVRNQCKGDHKTIGVRFEQLNGSYAASKTFASRRLSHQCPGEVEKPKPDDDKKPKPDDDKKPKPDDDKKPKPDDDKKPKPDDDKKPKPDDDKKPKPDDDKKPKPDDDKKPKPDDDKKPKPDDDKKPKPDDGNNPDKSMEDLLRRINDSLDRLNKNIEKSGSGSGGSGNGGGGHGSGNGGSGNGGGGHGSGGSGGGNGSGSGNGNGNGNGDHSGDGYSPPKDPDWGRLGGVKAPRYSKDGRFSEVGVCPKPVTFNLTVLRLSQTFAFSYEHVCDLAVRMRPILIACAYFAAGLICLAALER